MRMTTLRVLILGDHKVGKSVDLPKGKFEDEEKMCWSQKTSDALNSTIAIGAEDGHLEEVPGHISPVPKYEPGLGYNTMLTQEGSIISVTIPSAVTVRFLTKRFIGEYSSSVDHVYRSSIRQEDTMTDVEVLDTCSKACPSTVEESRVTWADAFVVVYSICSRRSFTTARELIQVLSKARSAAYPPVLLLGNKRDLEHRREVSVEEGYEVALGHACQYYEVSAADSALSVSEAFQAFLREVRIVQQQRAPLKRRRSSLGSVSKKLGAMFGKNSSSSKDSGGGGGGAGSDAERRRLSFANSSSSNSKDSSSGVAGSVISGGISDSDKRRLLFANGSKDSSFDADKKKTSNNHNHNNNSSCNGNMDSPDKRRTSLALSPIKDAGDSAFATSDRRRSSFASIKESSGAENSDRRRMSSLSSIKDLVGDSPDKRKQQSADTADKKL